MTDLLRPPAQAAAVVDLLKGFACSLIVLHHLAYYGPMSDYADDLFPGIFDWLSQHGRLAVQVFLVLGGYLAAQRAVKAGFLPLSGQAVPGVADLCRQTVTSVVQRYLRLAVPLWLALILAVLCNALADHWIDHHSISAAPQLWQALLHVLMLQDIMGQEALSAGIWYVAVDLQLFAMFMTMVALTQLTLYPRRNLVLLVMGLLTLSAFVFNRQPSWDVYAPYFWVSYGLGVVFGLKPQGGWLALAVALVVLSYVWEPRIRLLVALATAGMLWGWKGPLAALMMSLSAACRTLSQISYSVFLVHFPIGLVVNALWVAFLPHQPLVQLIGVLTAFKLSLLGGWFFHVYLEQPLLMRVHTRLFVRANPHPLAS